MPTTLRKNQQPSRRRGAAAVEFAFVIPVVITMVFGMIELGRGYLVQHILTETARRACRFGVALQSSQVPAAYSGNWNGYVLDNIVTPVLNQNGISGTTTNFYVTAWGTTDNLATDTSADMSTASGPQYSGNVYNPGSEVSVVITVPTSNVSWGVNRYLIGGTLKGQYTLRKE
jgi:Flp pilus assembly protein TadG